MSKQSEFEKWLRNKEFNDDCTEIAFKDGARTARDWILAKAKDSFLYAFNYDECEICISIKDLEKACK